VHDVRSRQCRGPAIFVEKPGPRLRAAQRGRKLRSSTWSAWKSSTTCASPGAVSRPWSRPGRVGVSGRAASPRGRRRAGAARVGAM